MRIFELCVCACTYVSVIIRLVIADIQLLCTSSANGEWQTVILQDWIKYWNVVRMCIHIYVCMYVL